MTDNEQFEIKRLYTELVTKYEENKKKLPQLIEQLRSLEKNSDVEQLLMLISTLNQKLELLEEMNKEIRQLNKDVGSIDESIRKMKTIKNIKEYLDTEKEISSIEKEKNTFLENCIDQILEMLKDNITSTNRIFVYYYSEIYIEGSYDNPGFFCRINKDESCHARDYYLDLETGEKVCEYKLKEEDLIIVYKTKEYDDSDNYLFYKKLRKRFFNLVIEKNQEDAVSTIINSEKDEYKVYKKHFIK